MWWLAETVSNCLSTPACQSCPSLIPTPSSLVLLLQLLIIFSLNCGGQTTFSDGCHFAAFAWKNILPWEEHTTSWHVFLLFWRGKKKWERHTCSFFCSLILLQIRDYELFLSERLEVESNPARWHRGNVDEIRSKRMDMCTYSLMYALEMETTLYRRLYKKSTRLKFLSLKMI